MTGEDDQPAGGGAVVTTRKAGDAVDRSVGGKCRDDDG